MGCIYSLKHTHEEEFFKQNQEKTLNFVNQLASQYLFDEVLKMILEYMPCRAKIQDEAFKEILITIKSWYGTDLTDAQIAKKVIVEIDFVQNICQSMTSVTKKIIKQ